MYHVSIVIKKTSGPTQDKKGNVSISFTYKSISVFQCYTKYLKVFHFSSSQYCPL